MRTLALCAGYGGLELGLELAGWQPDLVAYAEIDPHASKVMAHHWPDAPNLGDLTKITDPPPVDLIAAGFPCQDISTAGKRAGLEGARSGVWWSIAEIVGDIRPRRVVLENVAAIAFLGGPAVVGTLTSMGYSVRWGTVRASDIGACHRRERWFCVAWHADSPREGTLAQAGSPRHPIGESGGAIADAEDDGLERARGARRRGHGPADYHRPTANADSEPARRDTRGALGAQAGREDEPRRPDRDRPADGAPAPANAREATWGRFWPAIHRWERTIGRAAPAPLDDRGRLNPVLVEWMMGLPEGHVTDLDLSRAQMLHILGNGVVPQQAAYAIGQAAA